MTPIFFYFFIFLFLGLHLQHMGVSRLGVESELQLRLIPQPQQCTKNFRNYVTWLTILVISYLGTHNILSLRDDFEDMINHTSPSHQTA